MTNDDLASDEEDGASDEEDGASDEEDGASDEEDGASDEEDGASDEEDGAHAVLGFLGDALDPATLLPVIPLASASWKRKGDPLGRTSSGWAPVAKTGVCHFSTRDVTGDGNHHVAFVLRAIEPRIDDIRRVMAASELRWELTFFEGDIPGHRFTDLKPELFAWAGRLGLKLIQAIEGNLTVVTKRDGSGTGRD